MGLRAQPTLCLVKLELINEDELAATQVETINSEVNDILLQRNLATLDISTNEDDIVTPKEQSPITENAPNNGKENDNSCKAKPDSSINVNKHDEQPAISKLYSYVNELYCKLNSRFDYIVSEVESLQSTVRKINIDKPIADIDLRVTGVQVELLDIQKSLEGSKNQQKSNIPVKPERLEAFKTEMSNSIADKSNELKREIRENLTNANLQHNQFIEFKKEYETHIIPTLNRINEQYMGNYNYKAPKNPEHRSQKASTEDASGKKSDDTRPNNPLNKNTTTDRNQGKSDSTNLGNNTNFQNSAASKSKNSQNPYNKEIEIDCDVLFLGDSNLKPMKPEIMDNRNKCQYIYCPMLENIKDVVNNAKIKRYLKHVYLQAGTNDLDHDSVDTVSYQISDIIDLLKNKFKCTVVVSSILPRQDKRNEVAKLNEYLLDLCDGTKKLTFMHNLEIYESMLVDKKHINDDGFMKLLGNIRFTIFGKVPTFRRKYGSSNDHSNRQRPYRSNYNDNSCFYQDRSNEHSNRQRPYRFNYNDNSWDYQDSSNRKSGGYNY